MLYLERDVFGSGKNFFSREKRFFPLPNPHPFQEKRNSFPPSFFSIGRLQWNGDGDVSVLPAGAFAVAAGEKIFGDKDKGLPA